MVKLLHFPNTLVHKNNNVKTSPNVNQKLKLVVSNPSSASSQRQTISNSSPSSCFSVEVWPRGPNLYEMHLEEPAYGLRCDLILEVEEPSDDINSTSIVCHFPNIDDRALHEFVEEDETLFGMFMIQFQMKILEQLLLFCANHYASKLVIFVDDEQADALGVYRDFLSYEDETITSQGEKTEMVIPTDHKTFDQWVDFMEEVTANFQKTLWREQNNNLLVRQYLQRHSVLTA